MNQFGANNNPNSDQK